MSKTNKTLKKQLQKAIRVAKELDAAYYKEHPYGLTAKEVVIKLLGIFFDNPNWVVRERLNDEVPNVCLADETPHLSIFYDFVIAYLEDEDLDGLNSGLYDNELDQLKKLILSYNVYGIAERVEFDPIAPDLPAQTGWAVVDWDVE